MQSFFDAIRENDNSENFIFCDFMPYGKEYKALTINQMILYSVLCANEVLGVVYDDEKITRITDIYIDDLPLCKDALKAHGLINDDGSMIDIFIKHHKGCL